MYSTFMLGLEEEIELNGRIQSEDFKEVYSDAKMSIMS